MTPQAIVPSLERRPIGWLLGECVEDGAPQRIVRCKFDEAAEHPGHRHRVVKKDRAGVTRLNPIRLQAGFRENCDLRLNRDIESLQQRPQVALWAFKLQPSVARLKLDHQHADGICGRSSSVLNSRMIESWTQSVVQCRESCAACN